MTNTKKQIEKGENNMNTVDNQIKRCIYCKMGRQIIGDYQQFCEDVSSGDKEDIKESVDNISKTLGIEGTYSQKYNYIENLSNPKMARTKFYKDIHHNVKNKECVNHLNNIIASIRCLFESDEDNDNEKNFVNTLTRQSFEILYIMKSTFCDNIESLSEFVNRNCQELESYIKVKSDNNNNSNSDESCNLYLDCAKILDNYCVNKSSNIKCKYCNNTDSKDLRNCQAEMFLEFINSHTVHNKLKEEYQTILKEFLIKAPKDFGKLFTLIFNKQKLTEQEIANIWNKLHRFEDIEAGKIQSLKGGKTNDLSPEQIKFLSRILLVSEDVLKCGTGKIFGNFQIPLNPVRAKHKPTEEENNYLKRLKEEYKTDTIRNLRQEVINKIASIINLDDEDFYRIINENKEFFCEEDICLFTYEEDGEEYYDYDLMYENLLHPEDFDTLLSVLEELQAKENN